MPNVTPSSAPHPEDFALVVGVSRYPGLGDEGSSADLDAPDRDAALVAAWLKDPAGGGLDPDHVNTICSSDFSAGGDARGAKPRPDDICNWFDTLQDLAERNAKAGNDEKAGRRLYVYMAGHGFSPKRSEGGLFTANATRTRTYNVYATGWLEWFQDTNYFDEFVLWMDSCMDREFTVVPQEIPFRRQGGSGGAPGPTFIAFAAPRPLRTVERAIAADGGTVHGVFTWALLEGLRGAAADAKGAVTGPSLRDFLIHAQKGFLTEADRTSPDIASEPEIARADDGLVFREGTPEARYAVSLTVPATANADPLRVWSGMPLTLVATLAVTAGKAETTLPRGVYFAECAEAGLGRGFEVTGSGRVEVDVTQPHAPVQAPASADATFQLTVTPNEAGTEIFVIDAAFELCARGRGMLSVGQPAGLYKAKMRFGRGLEEQIILLDRDRTVQPSVSPITAAAPIPDTALTHEYHEGPGWHSDPAPDLERGAGARVSVMARVWSAAHGQAAGTGSTPWAGVQLVDARGRVIADLERDGLRDANAPDPFGICVVDLAPGAYVLRQRLADGREVEQSVIAVGGWQVHAYLLQLIEPHTLVPKGPRQVGFLSDRGAPRNVALAQAVETARIALADERRALDAAMRAMLIDHPADPVAGILGGLLLLLEDERARAAGREPSDLAPLNGLVTQLRAMGAEHHPDVQALSLACPDESLRLLTPLTAPPMFARSWSLLVAATSDHPEVVPAALWQRVRATVSAAPFLTWARDVKTRKSHLTQLLAALEPGLEAERTPARELTLGVRPEPAAATAARASDGGAGIGFGSMARVGAARRSAAPGARDALASRASALQVPASALHDLRRTAHPSGKR